MFEIYPVVSGDNKKQWAWRLILGPGKRHVAGSADTFASPSKAKADIARVRALAVDAMVYERD